MTQQKLLIALLLFAPFTVRADIVVGAGSARYGSLLVTGKPNPDVQADQTFSLRSITDGTDTEDGGEASGKPLNHTLRVRAGQYDIIYSNSHEQIEIKEGQTTTIKLQKVTPARLENTKEVALSLKHHRDDSEDQDSSYGEPDPYLVGTFKREDVKDVKISENCSMQFFHDDSFFGLGGYHQVCNPQYDHNPFTRPWSTGYFYVLPGTYTMIWTFADGTTHEVDDIEVK